MNYFKELKALQIELLKMQYWIKATGYRLIVIFEGRDTAGKGGAIKRFMEHLNPRGARVVALDKPSDQERSQWYFQRYVCHLPTAGEMVLFDRSWYNRAGVEPVMGFCTEKEHQQFLEQAPEFEFMLCSSGIHIIKFWFSVSQKAQARRLAERERDPLKHWKLTPIDRCAQQYWHDFTAAKERMFLSTHSDWAPWFIIRSDQKKLARLNAIRCVLSQVPYDKTDTPVELTPSADIISMPGEPKKLANK
jgi:polyphosphate kinase 2